MLLIDGAHERRSRWQDLIDEDEDGFLRRELDTLADDIDELTDSEVGGYEVLLLIDGSNVGFLNLFANHLDADSYVRPLYSKEEGLGRSASTYRNAISVFLSDAFSFGLALLEGVLILELGTHIDGRYGFG